MVTTTCVANAPYCLAHEFGHVLGCAHDRLTDRNDPKDFKGRFRFSFGYYFEQGERTIGDMMAYPGAENRQFYFSNPGVMFDGTHQPFGEPDLLPSGEVNPDSADCARTIRESQMWVANDEPNGD